MKLKLNQRNNRMLSKMTIKNFFLKRKPGIIKIKGFLFDKDIFETQYYDLIR